MIKKLIRKIISLIEKNSDWKVILLPSKQEVRLSAVKSDIGFWYAGNILDSSDIAYGIFRNGEVEKEETKLVLGILKKLSKPKFTFYDIGANSGYFGVMAAFVGKGNINTYSFEPLPNYAELIKISSILNKLSDNIKIFNFALGSENKTGTIQIAGSGSSLVPAFLGDNKLPVKEISIKKLDDVIVKEALPAPDFIKVDVEGYELDVIKGALNTITKAKPVLFIEIAFSLNNIDRDFKNPHAAEVFDLLTGLGYNAFIVKDGVHKVTPDSMQDGVYMYLFLDSENSNHLALINN